MTAKKATKPAPRAETVVRSTSRSVNRAVESYTANVPQGRAVAHTARVHAWYVSSDGVETHVTRRDDGKWYLNTTTPGEKAQYLSLEEAVDVFLLAHSEGRPHGWTPGLRDGQDFDAAVGPHLRPDRYGEPEEKG